MRGILILVAFSSLSAPVFSIEGRVTSLSGSAQLRSNGKTAPVKLGATIRERDILVTGASSRIGLLFSDGASFLMAADSEIEIRPGSVFYQATGTVSTSFRAQKPGAQWAVKTPTVVCAVRGTAFTVETSKTLTRVVMFKGKVIVKDFVRESGLPSDPNELMQDFLNDMEINSGTALTYNGVEVQKESVNLRKEKTAPLREAHVALEKTEAWKKAATELKLTNSGD